jgi:hypothetical protein
MPFEKQPFRWSKLMSEPHEQHRHTVSEAAYREYLCCACKLFTSTFVPSALPSRPSGREEAIRTQSERCGWSVLRVVRHCQARSCKEYCNSRDTRVYLVHNALFACQKAPESRTYPSWRTLIVDGYRQTDQGAVPAFDQFDHAII